MDIQKPKDNSDETLKMAIAMALFKSRFVTNANGNSTAALSSSAAAPVPPNSFQSHDALKWKRKVALLVYILHKFKFRRSELHFCENFQAKERKREILRLQEDLKVAEGKSYISRSIHY